MKENLKLGAILLVITLVAGVLLGFTNELTKEQIALNSRVSKDDLATVMPEADSIKETEFEIEEDVSEVYEALKGSEQIGYVLKVTAKGFKGPIDFVIGISNDDSISGIKVLSHSETPGLGAKIEEDSFREQFSGKGTTQELETVKAAAATEYEIEAISGATVSSKATTNAVNSAMRYYIEEIKGETLSSNSDDKYPLDVTDEKLFKLMPEATSFVEADGEFNSEILKVFIAQKDGEIIGHAIMASEEGFNGDVVLLVGIDNNDLLTGVEVVFQDETPNLGALVEGIDYRGQFVGKAISEDLAIEAISGATVTSDASEAVIKNVINCYLNEVKGKELGEKVDDDGSVSLTDERLVNLLENSTSIVVEDVELSKGILKVYKGLNGEETSGYVVMVSEQGFNDEVVLLVGINNDDTLSGIEVVSQDETDGLGALVVEENYRKQFIGKSVNELLKVKTGSAGENEIEAISSATVTSEASVKAVNNAMKFYVEKIK